jgi:transcriptional regulator with XRE-family HTH domain
MSRCFTNIAKFLKDKRTHHPKEYSQSELSNILGYKNGQFISNVERGLCSIPLKSLPKICQVLEINKDELKKVLLEDYEKTLEKHLDVAETPVQENKIEAQESANTSPKQEATPF